MTKTPDKRLITALDIGTSKVVALAAEIVENDQLKVIGIGTQSSRGLKKGIIVNIDATVKAIQKAVEAAEHMADCQFDSICVGIAGSHIQSFDSNGIVAIRGQEVDAADVERVVEAAKAVALPSDQKIIHILPQDFLIDNQEGIKEPIGMAGVRLEANVHLVTGSISAVQNIIKCVNRCGLEVSDMVLEQLASSYAVLTEDEKELGVCLVDIGAGTTDIAVFRNGSICHTAVLPVAGAQVTSDIAHALRTPTEAAENIKIEHGCAMSTMIKADDAIEIPSIAGRPPRRLPLQTLTGVVEARCEEILGMVCQNLSEKNLLDSLGGGVVLTGGAAKMKGLTALAEEVFRVPVRMGVPQHIAGLTDVLQNPMHATGVGLLQYHHNQEEETPITGATEESSTESIWQRMKGWFGKHF